MLSKCANPVCSETFRYFGRGKVFQVRNDMQVVEATHLVHKVEHYWLCPLCAVRYTICVNRKGEVSVLPLASSGHLRAAA